MATTDPNLNSIAADGWQADYTSPPTFDPVASPKYAVVDRPGFNASSAAVTVTDDVLIMSRVRQPYPDHASLTASTVALQQFIFSGDVITGVTNNSTETYPKAVAAWLDHDLVRVYDQTYTARLAVAHIMARSGRPVAAVKFIATDGTTTLEQVVSTMAARACPITGLSVPCFEHTFDFSTLDDDALITIDAVIYPWAGVSSQISVDYDAYGSANCCVLKVFNAVSASEDALFAYCSPTGNNGTGVVSTTAATAQASPFLTPSAAADAIKVADGTDVARGVIRLEAGTYGHWLLNQTAGATPLIIEGVDRDTVFYQPYSGNTSNFLGPKIKFNNLTIQRFDASAPIFLDSGGAAGSMLVLQNCAHDDNGFGTAWGAYFYKLNNVYVIDCEGFEGGLWSVFSTANKVHALVLGCKSDVINCQTYAFLGNHAVKASDIGCGSQGGAREVQTRQFVGWNIVGAGGDGNANDIAMVIALENDVAVVGNIFEQQHASATAVLVTAHEASQTAHHHIWHQNTFRGQRTNLYYNDSGFGHQTTSQRFNVWDEVNTKTDVFGANGAYIGNWPVAYRVGAMSNSTVINTVAPGVGSWSGEIYAIGDLIGALVPDYEDDASKHGTTLGAGDYHLGGSTEIGVIPAGQAPYATDLYGTATPDDGSAYAGAAPASATVITLVLGMAMADPDTFGAGSIAQVGAAQSITGAGFADPDTFGAGAVALRMAGTALVDPDTFGAGAVSLRMAGTALVDPDTFGAGAVSLAGAAQSITGTAFADADTFGAGQAIIAPVILGAAFADPDTFGAGVVVVAGAPPVVTGAAFADPDTFGAGAVSRRLAGAALANADTFGGGTVSLHLSGAALADADTFGAGAIRFDLFGAVAALPPAFGVGALLGAGSSTRRVASLAASANAGATRHPANSGAIARRVNT